MAISFPPQLVGIVQDALGLNAYGIGKLRAVEWGRNYLWAVRFTDPKCPKPFDDFFPASSVDMQLANLESYSFDLAQDSYKIPKNANIKEVSVTFFDDAQATLQRWMTEWLNVDILNSGNYVSCLLDEHKVEVPSDRTIGQEELKDRVWPIRTMEFVLLNNSMEEIEGTKQIVAVYPEGAIQFSGSSDSAANTFQVTFNIVGRLPVGGGKTVSGNDYLQKAKKTATQLLGRFF